MAVAVIKPAVLQEAAQQKPVLVTLYAAYQSSRSLAPQIACTTHQPAYKS